MSAHILADLRYRAPCTSETHTRICNKPVGALPNGGISATWDCRPRCLGWPNLALVRRNNKIKMLSLRWIGATASAIPRQCLQGRLAATGRLYSQSVRPLAYDLHEPASPRTDKKKAPILFLHGLFGSKKNNRGISKLVESSRSSLSCMTNNPHRALARDLGRYVYALVRHTQPIMGACAQKDSTAK